MMKRIRLHMGITHSSFRILIAPPEPDASEPTVHKCLTYAIYMRLYSEGKEQNHKKPPGFQVDEFKWMDAGVRCTCENSVGAGRYYVWLIQIRSRILGSKPCVATGVVVEVADGRLESL